FLFVVWWGFFFFYAPGWVGGGCVRRPGGGGAPDEAAPIEWEELYYAATLLYLARPGDFILLHLITSLYAVEHLCAVLPAEQRQFAVRCFWTGLLGIVFSGGDFPERAKLASLHELFADARDTAPDAYLEQDWRQTVARAVLEEEEHNPKLVHALRQVWRRGDRRSLYRVAAAQFTATPELPPTFEAPPTD
ncbi:questin oxidase family protein, partial [Streptomyces sp. NPDC058663]|uniref:questin oxidase family protein n=1 Tax=Streptomyces sp. NPDC058663 TaxID=3346584 RepID=UPI003668D8DB